MASDDLLIDFASEFLDNFLNSRMTNPSWRAKKLRMILVSLVKVGADAMRCCLDRIPRLSCVQHHCRQPLTALLLFVDDEGVVTLWDSKSDYFSKLDF